MKKIIVYSHQNKYGAKSKKCQNGDLYDSAIEVYDENGKLIYRTENANVDSSNNAVYQGKPYRVEVANGEYIGFIGRHGIEFDRTTYKLVKQGYPAIYICNQKLKDYIGKGLKWLDFFYTDMEAVQVLPSIYPNPNWGGQKIMKYIHNHTGGTTWDYSLGCWTVHPDDYTPYISNFSENEFVLIEKR